jgi:hypothetical protein
MAFLKVLYHHSLGESKVTPLKTLVKIPSSRTDIQTGHLQNTSMGHNHYTSPFSDAKVLSHKINNLLLHGPFCCSCCDSDLLDLRCNCCFHHTHINHLHMIPSIVGGISQSHKHKHTLIISFCFLFLFFRCLLYSILHYFSFFSYSFNPPPPL